MQIGTSSIGSGTLILGIITFTSGTVCAIVEESDVVDHTSLGAIYESLTTA